MAMNIGYGCGYSIMAVDIGYGHGFRIELGPADKGTDPGCQAKCTPPI